MATKFLMAKLISGLTVVAEFSKLTGTGQGYAGQVFAGRKPFNAWKVVSGTHPASGEPVLVRTREMFAGSQIASITQVKPLPGMETSHGYQPENFEPVREIQKGRYGMWTAPTTNTPEGAVPGETYPINRDESSMRRYVILKVAQGETAEVRFYLDAEQSSGYGDGLNEPAHVSEDDDFGPGDADEESEW